MQFSFCLACCYGKIHKFPFSSSETVYNQPLQLIQSDLWGPSPVQSSNGYHYYIHFVDAYSRFAWIYLLKHKLDAFQAFLNFKAQVELQLGFKIKAIQTDWGGEYQAFTNFLTSNGIVHRYSYPYTHEQNGLSERRHRTIVEHGLTLSAYASMPLKYWDEAFRTSVYLNNRLPTSVLHHKTPLETLFNISLDYSLKIFGCSCSTTNLNFDLLSVLFWVIVPIIRDINALTLMAKLSFLEMSSLMNPHFLLLTKLIYPHPLVLLPLLILLLLHC